MIFFIFFSAEVQRNTPVCALLWKPQWTDTGITSRVWATWWWLLILCRDSIVGFNRWIQSSAYKRVTICTDTICPGGRGKETEYLLRCISLCKLMVSNGWNEAQILHGFESRVRFRSSRYQSGSARSSIKKCQHRPEPYFSRNKNSTFWIKNNSSVTLLSYLLILVSFYRNCDNNSSFPIVVVIIQYYKFRIILFWELGDTGLLIWKSCEEGGRVRGRGVWVWIHFWRKEVFSSQGEPLSCFLRLRSNIHLTNLLHYVFPLRQKSRVLKGSELLH